MRLPRACTACLLFFAKLSLIKRLASCCRWMFLLCFTHLRFLPRQKTSSLVSLVRWLEVGLVVWASAYRIRVQLACFSLLSLTYSLSTSMLYLYWFSSFILTFLSSTFIRLPFLVLQVNKIQFDSIHFILCMSLITFRFIATSAFTVCVRMSMCV